MKTKTRWKRFICMIIVFVLCLTYLPDLAAAAQLRSANNSAHELTARLYGPEGTTFVKVTYGDDAMIPEGAKLSVSEITADMDAYTYDTYMEQAAEALSGDPEASLSVARLFDICIMSNGKELEPAAPVQVEITLENTEESEDDGGIQVVHFAEEDVEVLDTMILDEKDQIAVSFETDGFSLYAVVKLDEFDASQQGTSLAAKLNGQSYVIVSSTNSDDYGALDVTSMKSSVSRQELDSLGAVPVSVDTALSTYQDVVGKTATTWTFEANGTGFNIYTYIKLNDEMDVEVKRYLHFTVNESDSTLSSITLDETPQQLTVTEGTGELAGRYRISCDGNSLNLDSQDVEKGFYGWEGSNAQIQDPDKRKTLFMWFCTPGDDSASVQPDLDEHSFAIVYKGARNGDKVSGRDDNLIGNTNVALMAAAGTNLDGDSCLKAGAVAVDGDKIAIPGTGETTPTKWTFHRVSGDTTNTKYTISTSGTQYLAVDDNGQISLSDTPTEFTVTIKGNNRCRIGWTNSKGITYYLNLDNSNLQDGFNFWDAAWYDVPWYKDELSYGGDIAPDWLDSDPRFKTRAEGYNPGDEVYSTNWTWGVVVNEKWTVSELNQEQIDKGWTNEWKVQHAQPENEKLYLYLCEPYDESWPLNGLEYAIICARTGRSKALLTDEVTGNDGIQLAGSNNLLVLPGKEAFLDSNGDIPLWKFEKADKGVEWYYISTTVNGEKKYLSFTNAINTLRLGNERVPIKVYYCENENGAGYVFTLDDTDSNGATLFLNCQDGGFHNYSRNDGKPTANGDFFYLLTPTTQKSYAIVNLLYQDNANEVPGHVAGTGPREAGALRNDFRDNNKAILAGQVFVWDEVADDTRADNGTRYVYGGPNRGASPSQWMFFPAGGGNQYHIARINGTSLQYLKSATAGGTVTFSFVDEPDGNGCIFTMNAARLADGLSDSVVTIETYDGYRLYGVNDSSSTSSADYVIRAHQSTANPVPSSEQFVLCEIDIEVPDKIVAEKKAAGDIKNGDRVVIYYRELTDEKTRTYSYFAIGRDGRRHQVTDVSDSIKYWATDSQNIEWYVRNDGDNFMTFYNYNTMEERYYSILPGGNEEGQTAAGGIMDGIIQKGTVGGNQWEMTAIRLPGRELGYYGSRIENWIFGEECFYGIQYDKARNIFRPVEAGDSNEIEFYFAVVDDGDGDDPENKPTVDTVDSKALGITINMFDYGTGGLLNGSNVAGDRSEDIEAVLNYKGNWRGGSVEGYATAGILKPVLGEDGYPVTEEGNRSLSQLFGTGTGYWQGEANHLFLDSVYQTTGYLQYRSENNYAYYEGGDFTVYKSVGTTDYHQQAVYSHGDFFPYNELGDKLSDNNFYLFDYNGLQLSISDPRFGDKMYLINSPNYHFGMTLEANFSQPKDGIAKYGDPLYFAFNGDDDMWVYVDNVLLLDIGGIHDARSGFINFKTGEIWQQDDGNATKNELRTSIAQRFNDAGIFPDGTAWNDADADQYFINLTKDGSGKYATGTFVDYSEHSLNMYYLERGAGASNLDLTFNLMPLKDDTFYVSKILDTENGDIPQDEYENMEYTYRAYRFEATRSSSDGSWSTWTPGTETLLANTAYKLYDEDGQEIPGTHRTNSQGIFTLKPGQTAEFTLTDVHDGTGLDTETRTGYRVEELFTEETGENCQYQVYVNDEEQSGQWENPGASNQGWYVVSSGDLLLNDQYQVTFVNKLLNLAALQMIKKVGSTTYQEAVPDSSKTYTFVLFLENAEGNLVQYNGVYTIAGEKGERTTTNGRIQIKDGQTIQIENILPGKQFFFYEENGAGFDLISYQIDGAITEPKNESVWVYMQDNAGRVTLQRTSMLGITGTVEVDSTKTATSVVANNEIKTANVVIRKNDDEGNPLEGAVFELQYGKPEAVLKNAVKSVTGDGAAFTISDLPVNQIYKLVETKAPNGYSALKEPVTFQLYDAVDAAGNETLSGILFPGNGQNRADYLLTYEGTVYTKDADGAFHVEVEDESIFDKDNGIFFAPDGVEWKVETDGTNQVIFEVTIPNPLKTEEEEPDDPPSVSQNSPTAPTDDPKAPPTITPQTPGNPESPQTLKLPQTGQLWWPVMVMSVAGLLFFLVGFFLVRSQRTLE